jgi:hypothetical protein
MGTGHRTSSVKSKKKRKRKKARNANRYFLMAFEVNTLVFFYFPAPWI